MFNGFFETLVAKISWGIFVKEVAGVENLPKDGAFIVASNHTSYMDIWALEVVLYLKKKKYIRFLARKDLVHDFHVRVLSKIFETPLNKPIYFDAHDLGKELFRESIKALKKRQIIGIFPEGARSLNGRLQKGKTGVVRLAIKSRVPVVPVGIKGTFELMPIGKNIPKIKKNITLGIGKPIYFDKFYKKKITKRLLRTLTDNIMSEIAKLSDQRIK